MPKRTDTYCPKGENAAKLRFSAWNTVPTRSRTSGADAQTVRLQLAVEELDVDVAGVHRRTSTRLSTAKTICNESSRCADSSRLTSQMPSIRSNSDLVMKSRARLHGQVDGEVVPSMNGKKVVLTLPPRSPGTAVHEAPPR